MLPRSIHGLLKLYRKSVLLCAFLEVVEFSRGRVTRITSPLELSQLCCAVTATRLRTLSQVLFLCLFLFLLLRTDFRTSPRSIPPPEPRGWDPMSPRSEIASPPGARFWGPGTKHGL
jgi:hypothetical protein